MSEIIEDKLVKDAYSKIAQLFNDTRRKPWNWQQKFIDEIGNGFYYDIGCGGGRLLKEGQSIGIDSCPKFVEIVKNKGLRCIEGDMTKLPFENETADAILCIASFHHLSTTERRLMALKEMYRLLKPTGKILISVWSKTQPHDTDVNKKFNNYKDVIVPWFNAQQQKLCDRYYYIFEKEELEKLFKQIGFKIESYEWDYGNDIYKLTRY
jgi:tRNA (uracil-5-)-methyltransferase TRM9